MTWRITTRSPPPAPRPEPRTVSPTDTPELATLQSALDAIPNVGDNSLSYDDIVAVFFALHHTLGDAGLPLATAFAAKSEKYVPGFLEERTWPYIKPDRENPITIRTLYKMAGGYGWTEPIMDDFDVLEGAVVSPTGEAGSAAAAACATPPPPKHPKFHPYPWSEFADRPAPRWIVKNLLPQAELAVIFGESGSGKSFFALDLVAAVAQGVVWRGLRVRQGRVAYICAEGAGGFRNRLQAYARARQISPAAMDMVIIPDCPNFLQDHDVAIAQQLKLAGGYPYSLIVVDTLAQVTPGGDENGADDMGKVIGHCKRLHRATGALIILIHHAGKDLTKGARGWSGLRAAADAEIEISHAAIGGDRIARVSKQKDGEEGLTFGFRLIPTVIGQDEDGDPITSCVLEHFEQTRVAKVSPLGGPTGRNQRLLHRLITDMAEDDGMVAIEAVTLAALHLMPSEFTDTRKRDAARQAIGSLVGSGFVRVDGERVGAISAAPKTAADL